VSLKDREIRKRRTAEAARTATNQLNSAALDDSHLSKEYMKNVILAANAKLIREHLEVIENKLEGFDHVPWETIHAGYRNIITNIQDFGTGSSFYTAELSKLIANRPNKE